MCAIFGIVGTALHRFRDSSPQTWSLAACDAVYVAGEIVPTIIETLSLKEFQLNVDLLMIVAAAIGDCVEGVVLMFLLSLSGTLEAFAMYRTTRSIESLIQLRPREAMLVLERVAKDRRVTVESLQ